jgi:hypothetical protein
VSGPRRHLNLSAIGDSWLRMQAEVREKRECARERMQEECLIKAHDILCGSIPSLFMRETNVLRFSSMRAAAPLGPATRPFVIFKK